MDTLPRREALVRGASAPAQPGANRSNALRVLAAVALVALASCVSTPEVSPVATASSSPEPSRLPSVQAQPSPTASSTTTVGPVHLVGHALPFYPDFAGWVEQWDGMAVVEITAIGPVQWNTASGVRPPDDELGAGLSGESGVDFFIGRPLEFRVVEVLRGEALTVGDTDVYWLPGGSVGADQMDTHPHFEVDNVTIGDRALAFTFAAPVDFGGSGVETRTGFLFLIDDAGRVLTLAPDEVIRATELGSYLP